MLDPLMNMTNPPTEVEVQVAVRAAVEVLTEVNVEVVVVVFATGVTVLMGVVVIF